ncbi:hypothetical protein MASR2M70_12750 [Bacillota bacterium]
MQLFIEQLRKDGVPDNRIIFLNFEDIRFEHLKDYRALYNYVSERLAEGQMTYVILDEVQNVPEFQKAVDSLFIQDHVDVYVAGSNAFMLSGELATLLSGRYIEIRMLPLSFAEFFELTGGERKKLLYRLLPHQLAALCGGGCG